MPKCIYKCNDDGTCARSTCEHHCKVVSDETCNNCMLNQETTIVSDKVLLKRVMENTILALRDKDINAAIILLGDGLKI